MPDKEYFVSQIPEEVSQFVQVQFRFCGGCASHQVMCGANDTFDDIRFEHIAQTMILDDSIQLTFPDSRNASGVLDKLWSITSQEFIFRYFLKNRYPQVFLIFLPFSHAKYNIKLDRLKMEIQYFNSLVEYYFPKTTQIFYIPSYNEPGGSRFEGMLAGEKINKMNEILYQLIESKLLKTDGRVFSFLDLYEASLSRGEWYSNAVHLKPVWYENIMTMFWETFCNSVMMNEF